MGMERIGRSIFRKHPPTPLNVGALIVGAALGWPYAKLLMAKAVPQRPETVECSAGIKARVRSVIPDEIERSMAYARISNVQITDGPKCTSSSNIVSERLAGRMSGLFAGETERPTALVHVNTGDLPDQTAAENPSASPEVRGKLTINFKLIQGGNFYEHAEEVYRSTYLTLNQ